MAARKNGLDALGPRNNARKSGAGMLMVGDLCDISK